MWGGLIAASLAINAALIQNEEQKKRDRRNQMNQAVTNQQQRNTEYQFREIDRRRALEDWNAQNAYNSPQEQMNRLRQAGLNPNLVYGKGAETTAQAVRDSGSKPSGLEAPKSEYTPDLEGSTQNMLHAFQSQKLTQAQTDNVNQQTALSKQQELFTKANTLKALKEGARTDFDLKQSYRMQDMVVKEMEMRLKKSEVDTQYTLDENRRKELFNTRNIQKTLVDIERGKAETALTRENIKLLQNTDRVRQVEAELAEAGIMPSDATYYKLFMKLLHEGKKALDHLRDTK